MASDGLETPLWAFSLAVYGTDGVAAECLELQDRFGVDVNLLLFAAYAAAVEGVSLDAPDIAAAIDATSAWHADIVCLLRGARRALKPAALDDTDPLRAAASGLRARVKANELEAEKIEQAMLWSWWRQSGPRRRGNAEAALEATLEVLLVHYGAPGGLAALAKLRAASLIFASSKF